MYNKLMQRLRAKASKLRKRLEGDTGLFGSFASDDNIADAAMLAKCSELYEVRTSFIRTPVRQAVLHTASR
jgi:hypothetical protein